MKWYIENEFELDDYIVESRHIEGRHNRIEYRLVRKTRSVKGLSNESKASPRRPSRRIASKQQLLSLHEYLSEQLSKLPFLEYGDESELEEFNRYEKLYFASEDYVRIHSKLLSKSSQLDRDEVAEWVYAWSEYLEILYEKNNSELRKRFLKSEKNKHRRRVEKREQTKRDKLPNSKQAERALVPQAYENYALTDDIITTPFHQFKTLERNYDRQHPKFHFLYHREHKTLYLKPKLANAVSFSFSELSFVRLYFNKPRVLNRLSDAEKRFVKKHFELTEIVEKKQKQKVVDVELLETWVTIYDIWEKHKSRYHKLRDDFRNNNKHYLNS